MKTTTLDGIMLAGLALSAVMTCGVGATEDFNGVIGLQDGVEDNPGKWEQPPLDREPFLAESVFCGWDQLSYVVLSGSFPEEYLPLSGWYFVTDDFRCLGAAPITRVHWWGSYRGWDDGEPPAETPMAWLLTFWSNEPNQTNIPFDHPGELLQMAVVDADRVEEGPVGLDRFPDHPNDVCFKYLAELEPDEVFHQQDYQDLTTDSVFWLGVTALYDGQIMPEFPWGWKTRPAHWRSDGVSFFALDPDVNVGWQPPHDSMIEILHRGMCELPISYDMSFALDTDPNHVKWSQPFTGLDDWPHYEDEASYSGLERASSIAIKWTQPPDFGETGMDVDATHALPPLEDFCPGLLADDFECTSEGPLTGITVWGSWLNDQLPPDGAADASFVLSIRENITAEQNPDGYSIPGDLLWGPRRFDPGQYSLVTADPNILTGTKGYLLACNNRHLPNNHQMVYRYGFEVPEADAFVQDGTPDKPKTYWLTVQAKQVYAPDTAEPTRFGWATARSSWQDAAVWAEAQDDPDTPYNGPWNILLYPLEHPLVEQNVDLAFEMTTSSQSSTELIERQVADDFRCVGQSPVTSAVWWGSYLGHYYKPCECWSPFPPVRPDYFLLSIWENIPDPDPEDPATFSQPGQRLWTYRAESFDEVLVGYDKHPEFDFHEGRAEAVYRYSVKLPRDDWFWQSSEQDVYWFSIVAVYDRNVTALEYPWGWTNHAHVYQDNAVAGQSPSGVPSGDDLVWEPLYDQTQSDQDMSFMLFTDPNAVLLPPIDPPIPPDPPIDPPLPPNPPIPPVDPLS